jgi:hypothetical protein
MRRPRPTPSWLSIVSHAGSGGAVLWGKRAVTVACVCATARVAVQVAEVEGDIEGSPDAASQALHAASSLPPPSPVSHAPSHGLDPLPRGLRAEWPARDGNGIGGIVRHSAIFMAGGGEALGPRWPLGLGSRPHSRPAAEPVGSASPAASDAARSAVGSPALAHAPGGSGGGSGLATPGKLHRLSSAGGLALSHLAPPPQLGSGASRAGLSAHRRQQSYAGGGGSVQTLSHAHSERRPAGGSVGLHSPAPAGGSGRLDLAAMAVSGLGWEGLGWEGLGWEGPGPRHASCTKAVQPLTQGGAVRTAPVPRAACHAP